MWWRAISRGGHRAGVDSGTTEFPPGYQSFQARILGGNASCLPDPSADGSVVEGRLVQMGFRLIVCEAADLTTIRAVGRLREDGVIVLADGCAGVSRPLALDLSELTGASEAGVLLLEQLRREGVHLLAASPYIRLLLERVAGSSSPAVPRRRSGSRSPGAPPTAARRKPRP
jgi:hypothetical protein